MVKTKKRVKKRKNYNGGLGTPADLNHVKEMYRIIKQEIKTDEDKVKELIDYLSKEEKGKRYGKFPPNYTLLAKNLLGGNNIMHFLAKGEIMDGKKLEGEPKGCKPTITPVEVLGVTVVNDYSGYVNAFEYFLKENNGVLEFIQEKTSALTAENNKGKTPYDYASECNNGLLTKERIFKAIETSTPLKAQEIREKEEEKEKEEYEKIQQERAAFWEAAHGEGGSRKGFKRRASSKKSKRRKTSKKL